MLSYLISKYITRKIERAKKSGENYADFITLSREIIIKLKRQNYDVERVGGVVFDRFYRVSW